MRIARERITGRTAPESRDCTRPIGGARSSVPYESMVERSDARVRRAAGPALLAGADHDALTVERVTEIGEREHGGEHGQGLEIDRAHEHGVARGLLALGIRELECSARLRLDP